MKCRNCFALFTEGYEYPEEYCGAGVPKDGKMSTEEGCRYSAKEIRKRLEHRERLISKQYDGCGEWYHEQQLLDAAMNDAVKKGMDDYFAGQLYLCFRDREGKYYPLRGDGVSCDGFVYRIRDEYEKQEAEVQRTYCERCRWNGKKQKCACCRRNRHMKDNYCEVETAKEELL